MTFITNYMLLRTLQHKSGEAIE